MPGLGSGGGQSCEKGISLLTWVRSASRIIGPISSAGYSTPWRSIVVAVARTRAVTPVSTSVVSLEGSRLVAGRKEAAAESHRSIRPRQEIGTVRGYAAGTKFLRTGDCPSSSRTFQRG